MEQNKHSKFLFHEKKNQSTLLEIYVFISFHHLQLFKILYTQPKKRYRINSSIYCLFLYSKIQLNLSIHLYCSISFVQLSCLLVYIFLELLKFFFSFSFIFFSKISISLQKRKKTMNTRWKLSMFCSRKHFAGFFCCRAVIVTL